MTLEGGGVTVLEILIQGLAMPRLDAQGQEVHLENATLSSATPIHWGPHPPETFCLGVLKPPRGEEPGMPPYVLKDKSTQWAG